MATASARALAVAALDQWRHGHRFADAILQHLLSTSELSGSDRSFATELFYGILRNLSLLDFWIGELRSGSLDDRSRDLLRLGLYQLFCLNTAGHAAVFETVALAPKTSRSLVNAILRNALRRADELRSAADAADLAIRKSHPTFLIERWTEAFGIEPAAALCEWNNQPAPIYARVNQLKTDTAAFASADDTRQVLPDRANFVRLSTIPGDALERGECYIQDPSTAVACELLDAKPGEAVLDACAAPGGKTAYLAERMQNRGELIACDREPARLAILTANLERLGATIAKIAQQDWLAEELAPALHRRYFDRILVDAPCTNTGVMRRRVDVRWRLTRDDFARMAAEQLKILRAVVPRLKRGGALVYSTCSIEPEENDGVVTRLLKEFPSMRFEEQRSVLPFRDGFDGAFASKLIRAA
ncbi:MAG: 16S rRNA (cytosine(967)-C(5))-methyltransferase RsmB [Chthoniobacterales bacterium]